MKAAQAMDAMREMVAESASGPIKVGREMDGWLLPDPEMMNAEWVSMSSLQSLIMLSGTTLAMVYWKEGY